MLLGKSIPFALLVLFRGLSRRNFGGRGKRTLYDRHSPDPQLSYGIGFKVDGCKVSESINAQNTRGVQKLSGMNMKEIAEKDKTRA